MLPRVRNQGIQPLLFFWEKQRIFFEVLFLGSFQEEGFSFGCYKQGGVRGFVEDLIIPSQPKLPTNIFVDGNPDFMLEGFAGDIMGIE